MATRCCQDAATGLEEALEEVRGSLESRGQACGLMYRVCCTSEMSTRQAIDLLRRGEEHLPTVLSDGEFVVGLGLSGRTGLVRC